MARSDEAEWWFNAVYSAVQEIPLGQVTSYGHIARLLGRRKIFDYLQLSPLKLQSSTCWEGHKTEQTSRSGVAECPRSVALKLHFPQKQPFEITGSRN